MLTNNVAVDAATMPVATDAFARTTSGGWGAADLGGSWNPTGRASRWAVANGKGRFTMEAPGTGASNRLDLSTAEVDGHIDVAIDKRATGGGVHIVLEARSAGSSYYEFPVKLRADGSVHVKLARVVNGVASTLAEDKVIPGLSYAAGDVLRLRFQATGTGTTTLRAKVWKAGSSEPTGFQSTATDSSADLQRPGGVAIRSYLSSSATNAPVSLSVDHLDIDGVNAPVSSPTTQTTRTLVSATFDALPLGRVTAAGFRSQLRGGNTNQEPYEDSSVVTDSRGTGHSYRLKLDAGSYKNYPSGNNGIVTFVELPEQVDQACLRYDLRFDSNFDWSLGGKLPGLQGTAPGVSPGTPTGGGKVGDKGWSDRMMWLGPKAYSWAGPTDMAVSYLYSPHQESYYGDNLPWRQAFVAGRWHTVKQCMTMNTVGAANGQLSAWFDGTQVLNLTNYVFRLRNDVHVKHLNWSIFRGGNDTDWAGARTGYVDVDNVKVTTTD